MKWLIRGLGILIAIGIVRGLIHYNNTHGGDGLLDLLWSIIDGVADITYRWIPQLLQLIFGG